MRSTTFNCSCKLKRCWNVQAMGPTGLLHWTKGHHQTCRKRRTSGISWSNIYMEVHRRIYIYVYIYIHMYNTKCSEVMIVHVAECCNSWIQDVKLRVVRSKHSISGTCGRWLRYDGILRWCQLTQMDKWSKRCLIDVYGLIPDWESRIQLYAPFAYFHEMVAWIFHLLNSAFASWTRSRPFFWPGGLFGPPKTTPEIGMHLYIYTYIYIYTRSWRDGFRNWHDTPINPHFHGFSTLLSSLNLNFQLVFGEGWKLGRSLMILGPMIMGIYGNQLLIHQVFKSCSASHKHHSHSLRDVSARLWLWVGHHQ